MANKMVNKIIKMLDTNFVYLKSKILYNKISIFGTIIETEIRALYKFNIGPFPSFS